MAVEWITPDDLVSPNDPFAVEAAEAASWILYRLSGQKFPGIRTSTEWYGLDHSTCWCGSPTAEISMRAHAVAPPKSTRAGWQLRLRQKPVQSVVRVSGPEGDYARDSYHLVNDAYLIRTTSVGWDFQTGVEVEYTWGTAPPAMGVRAAIKLGDELLKSVIDPGDCALPDRVTSVSRQGMSFTILDPQDFLKEGRTGVYEVDLFLATANPSGALKRAKVFSPDIPRGERRR